MAVLKTTGVAIVVPNSGPAHRALSEESEMPPVRDPEPPPQKDPASNDPKLTFRFDVQQRLRCAECGSSLTPSSSYERWLGVEFDPHDLLITYQAAPMIVWRFGATFGAQIQLFSGEATCLG